MVQQGRPTRRLVAVTAALVLTLAACSDDSSGEANASTTTSSAPSTTSTTVAPSTTSTTVSAEDATIREAFDAYVHVTNVFSEVAAAPDPGDPRIAETTTEPMLQVRVQGLGRLQAAGQRIAQPPDSVFQLELVDGSGELTSENRAVFTACLLDDTWVQDVATGEPATGEIWTVEVEVAMVREADTWKLSEQDLSAPEAGAVGCADGWV